LCGVQKICEYENNEDKWVKSHDYHIMMERLIPVMCCDYINDEVWKAIAELAISTGSFVLKKSQKR